MVVQVIGEGCVALLVRMQLVGKPLRMVFCELIQVYVEDSFFFGDVFHGGTDDLTEHLVDRFVTGCIVEAVERARRRHQYNLHIVRRSALEFVDEGAELGSIRLDAP